MLTPTIWKHGNTETTGSYQPQFVNALQTSGRMIYARIYQNGSLLFDESTINNLTISFDGGLLKSVMRVVEIELNGLYYLLDQEFSSIQIGVSDDQGANIYYVDYGKFIVGPENEQSIETNTTKITCYDQMLRSMIQYDLNVSYTSSTTNRQFLSEINNRIGITTSQGLIPSTGVMAMVRNHETYTEQNTFRDVYDDFAEILGGCLIISNNKLKFVSPTATNIVITEEQLKKITYKEAFGAVTSLTLSRMPQEDNVSYPDNPSEGEAVKIENNLLVEGYQDDSGAPDRTPYLQPIYNSINAWGQFYPVDLESFGYCLYEPCDMFTVLVQKADGTATNLPILWMNSTIKVGPGLEEDMECERPEFGETDYTKSSSSAIAEKNTYLYVDKVGQTIEAHVESVEGTVGSLADRVPVNMLYDTNAPSLAKVYASKNRYFYNSNYSAYMACSIVSINNPPRSGIDNGARFSFVSTYTSNIQRSLIWYDGAVVPMTAGTTYTMSCYARVSSAVTGNFAIVFRYGHDSSWSTRPYTEVYDVVIEDWVKYSWTFTAEADYIDTTLGGARVGIGATMFANTTAGAVELCNFMLQEGTPSDVTAKGSSLQMDLNGIRGDIYEITKEGGTLDSKITASAGEILSTVSETYTTAEDVDGILTSKDYVTSSTLTQTSDNIKQEFSEQIKGIGTNSQDIAEIKTWIIGDINGVTVGKSNSAIRGRFSNSQLAFTDSSGNTKYAWLDAIEGLGASEISIGKPDSGSTSNLKKRWRIFASDDGTHLTFTRHS